MTNGKPANTRASANAPRPPRRAKFIAVANMKGGVGKTTTVVGLAEFLAIEKKASVLVVDLDQQASASLCIVGDALLAQLIQQGRTIDAYLKLRILDGADTQLGSRIRRFTCNVTNEGKAVYTNLLPSGPRLRTIERDLLIALTSRKMSLDEIGSYLSDFFEKDFDRLRDEFDYVLFDCAPGISPFTEVAINSSDLVIVPTIPDRISAFGLFAFVEQVVKKKTSAPHPRTRVLFTRVQAGVVQQISVQKAIRAEACYDMINAVIGQSATLAAGIFPDDTPVGATPQILTLNQKYGPIAIAQFKALASEVG